MKLDFIILSVAGWTWTAVALAYLAWRLGRSRDNRVADDSFPPGPA